MLVDYGGGGGGGGKRYVAPLSNYWGGGGRSGPLPPLPTPMELIYKISACTYAGVCLKFVILRKT